MVGLHARRISALLAAFARDDQAATSIEYALIAVIMTIGLVAALGPLRDQLGAMLSSVATAMANALAG